MEVYVLFLSFLSLGVHSLNRDECGVSNVHNYGDRIAGGREALKGEFPWMASLQKLHFPDMRFHHFCGAVILNKHWLLSAAHCVDSIDPTLVEVVVGTNHISVTDPFTTESGLRYNVEKIIYPHQFSRSPPHNDISLLRIRGELNLKASEGMINRVCLPHEDYDLFGWVTATGWGRSHTHSDLSTRLLAVDIQVTTQDYCRSKYGYNQISDYVFCAGAKQGKDSCSGDSGGPVIQMEENRALLVGIISYGSNMCGRSGWPGVYTEVSKYLQWIYDTIEE